MKIEMNQAFWTIVKKATFLAHFVDLDHQNRNFTVSKTSLSTILYRQRFFTYRRLFKGLRIYKTQSQFSGICGLKG